MKKVLILLICLLALPSFVCGADKVDINTATLAQLDTLTGIGPVYAQRIIDGRPYSSVDELDRVKGIGPATLQKIKDQGLACVACATQEISNSSNLPNYSNQTTSPNTQTTGVGGTSDVPPATTAVYSSGIFINEIMPNPQGADETDEWIELYNSTNAEVDLAGWKLQDTIGTITTYTIPQNTRIMANGFKLFQRPDTKIMLNNDQDTVNLLTPDGSAGWRIIESVGFSSAPLGQSYCKTGSDPLRSEASWKWSATLTPGAKNIIPVAKVLPASATPARNAELGEAGGPKALQAGLPKAENSAKNDGVAASLVDSINQSSSPDKEPSGSNGVNPWFLFFIVLATTIVLAVIVLFIKLRLQGDAATKP